MGYDRDIEAGPRVVEEPTGPRVVPALRRLPPESALEDIAAQRARQFLRSQTAILVFAVAVTSFARMSGLLEVPQWRRYMGASAITALVTAAGWALRQTSVGPRRLVLGLLVVDALVGYPAVFVSGGLGTPAAAGILLCLVMTPLFVGRRYLGPMAWLHWGTYSLLFYLGGTGVLDPILPAALESGAVAWGDRVAHWVAFTSVCFGLTLLVGIPSLDTVLHRALLADEVRRNTAALERTSHKLVGANSDLAGLNVQLQSANAELVTVNEELESAVAERSAANVQLGRSNAELASANDELERTIQALQRSNERLDQFNTAVSHDLRAPLQAMMARAELAALAAHTDPARVARMADQICESAARMALQLDELHKLSRVEDRLDSVEVVPLGALLGQIVHDLEPKIRARRVNLEVVHPLPHLVGSRPLLAELFQNLVDNAIKYGSADQPRVRVEALELDDGWVGAAVEDNGPGVPPDQRRTVFELFRRLPRDQGAEGVGAGLAIVRRIVHVHGGTVSVREGAELGGARFEVRLPAAAEDVQPTETHAGVGQESVPAGGVVGEA